jgi:NAD(P) transhydrogenase subunit beta
MELNILTFVYLIASVTFILGLKMLSNPATARRGNLIAAGGMTLAILGTIFLYEDSAGKGLGNYAWIFAGLFIGAVIGTLAARKVKMTAMPEMVSLFNGMGGACAALISIVEFNHMMHLADGSAQAIDPVTLLIILLGLIIGTVSFAGSMIAWGKLNGKVKDFSFKGQHLLNNLFIIIAFTLAAYMVIGLPVGLQTYFYIILGLSLFYGVFFVLPIGGADMPVVISLLNS